MYVGEVGGYWDADGCTGPHDYKVDAANRANANAAIGDGVGAFGFFFAGGPGADPYYDGTTSEANAWGATQAFAAIADAAADPAVTTVLWIDVEDTGSAPFAGWNEETKHDCTGDLKSSTSCCTPAVARATVSGFDTTIYDDSSYYSGIYSTPGEWSGIFGSGSSATVTDTMEWSADWGGGCSNPGPQDWTQDAGTCLSHSANFFGTVTSAGSCAVAWQWSGGTYDYDQIQLNRLLSCE